MEIIQYQESFGPVRWQEGFEKELTGRTIEEQLRCFAMTEYGFLRDVPFTELESAIRQEDYYRRGTHAVYQRWSVIVKDDMVVGVACNKYDDDGQVIGKKPLLPYQRFVYTSTSDNNGSGYKERDWYKYLVCLPYNHTLW